MKPKLRTLISLQNIRSIPVLKRNKTDLREILSGTDIYIYLNNLESESKEMSSEPL